MGRNKTVLINMLSTIILHGSALFTAPIFSRLLGTSNYGIVSTFNTWGTLIVIVFPLCVNSTLGMAIGEYEADEQKKYQSSIFILGSFSFLFFALVTILLIKPVSQWMHADFLFVILLLITSFGNYCIEFATARNTLDFKPQRNFVMSMASLIGNICLGLPLVLILNESNNYYGKLISYAVTSIVIGLIVSIDIVRSGKTGFHWRYWRFCLPLCIPVIFHSLSNTILSQSDRLMLQSMVNDSVTGIYSLAYSFAGVLIAIYSALNNSWIPFYYKYIHDKEYGELTEHASNYVEMFTVICCGFILLHPEVYKVFASSDYWDGLAILPIIVIGFYFMFLYSLAINYEFYHRKTKFMAFITVSAAVLNLGLNYFGIGEIGMAGAAIATVASYLYEFLIHHIFVKKIFGEEYPFNLKFYFRHMMILMITLAIFYIFRSNWFVRWIVGMMLGIGLCFKMIKRKEFF